MVGGACPFSKSNDPESAGDSMISSTTTEKGGTEVALPRNFCRYSSQSFLDLINIALQLVPDWAAGGHSLAAIQFPFQSS